MREDTGDAPAGTVSAGPDAGTEAGPQNAAVPGPPTAPAPPGWAPGQAGAWGPPPPWARPRKPPGWFERFGMRLYNLLERPAWLAPFAVLGCVAAAFTFVLATDPTDGRTELGPCAFKYLTGLDCPGCGGTRMVWYLLHADIPDAARHHLMALIAVPALGYAYVSWFANRLTRWRLPVWKPSGRLLAAYGIGWLVFVVARNLPWEPFSYFYV